MVSVGIGALAPAIKYWLMKLSLITGVNFK